MKLLSKGYLTVQLFVAKTDFMKRLCVGGFVSAAFLQLVTLIIVTVCRLEERVTLIGEISGVLVSLGVFTVVLAAMRVDMHTYKLCKHTAIRYTDTVNKEKALSFDNDNGESK
ncbi:hypothetical protein TrVE_jg11811 [Triparma verrucosa]|uniref:Uncharacterized protein n=1 Tax=Triparma verrucosa TaxID=1606542 RepID=A0A9W7FJ73_9STRA|nr:hypothetical protein TrVE_jg11811 [Triparma verrucosa]